MGCSKKSSKREFYSNKPLHQEKKNLNLNLYLKELEKELSPKLAEIIKIRAKINEIKIRKPIKKSTKLKVYLLKR